MSKQRIDLLMSEVIKAHEEGKYQLAQLLADKVNAIVAEEKEREKKQ